MNEISLSNIFSIIMRRIWLVIIVTVLCAALAFSYCVFLATPVYSARTSILITNGGLITDSNNDAIQTGDLSASIYLVDTCVDILRSQKIYRDLSIAIGEKYTYNQLKGAFTVTRREEENLFIDISFKSTNPEEAKIIANAFTNLCPTYMAEKLPAVTVEVMDEAYEVSTVYPSTIRTSVIFAFFGAIITCLILLLLSFLDQTIKCEEDFVESFNIPVLGSVPDFENSTTYAYRAKTESVSTGGVQ